MPSWINWVGSLPAVFSTQPVSSIFEKHTWFIEHMSTRRQYWLTRRLKDASPLDFITTFLTIPLHLSFLFKISFIRVCFGCSAYDLHVCVVCVVHALLGARLGCTSDVVFVVHSVVFLKIPFLSAENYLMVLCRWYWVISKVDFSPGLGSSLMISGLLLLRRIAQLSPFMVMLLHFLVHF